MLAFDVVMGVIVDSRKGTSIRIGGLRHKSNEHLSPSADKIQRVPYLINLLEPPRVAVVDDTPHFPLQALAQERSILG